MLEHYFEKPTRLRQLRRDPLGPYIDNLAAELHRAGYSKSSARFILSQAGKFSRFARLEGVERAEQVGEDVVERYLTEELPAEGTFTGAANAMRHMLEHLRRRGVVPPLPPPVAVEDPFDVLLDDYDRYLRDVRGLKASTRKGYRRGARYILDWQRKRDGDRPLGKLSGEDVLTFITEFLAQGHGAKWRQHVCSQTRGFLRFLAGEGLVAAGLDRAVPKTPHWKLSDVPRHLPWEQVRALIDSVDTTYALGMRDKAVLLLLAVLGLRGGEIQALELGHISWRTGELRLPATKNRRERVLPVPQEVGSALADYLLHGRPPIDVPQVFLRHRAPRGPIRSSGGVGEIVEAHLRRTGIVALSRGTHLLRHSLATRMVNVGVPIKTIADVLGHSSIDTTAIYTKVDTTRLAMAALPFPDGGAR